MVMDEGVIKYHCDWIKGKSVEGFHITALMQKRDLMHSLGLIGVYENGIGFGNISHRINNSYQFIISGTQTAHFPILKPEYYTVVTNFNIEENSLTCCGAVKASSESLTHAAIYYYQPEIMSIIHIHNHQLWQELMFKVPTSNPDVPYGTPQMAKEMFRLFDEENLGTEKILVMAGHEDGIISFGKNLDEAANILLNFIDKTDLKSS
ncbi:class II aldolase/adducin family protein [Okeania sp.]|uniref:class II aldolase/adducin family protein n=1 Tax=Okeania sp. TaxID=3100323 RepID=UPI002B4B2FC4|nr:class II aldolase/adducin family protein [Okeania sp.]MEB3342036.1 class II aldolase/adducin family protein [Okeania sp.]